MGAGLRGKGSEDVSPGVRGRSAVLADEGGVTPCVSSRHLCCRLGGTSRQQKADLSPEQSVKGGGLD